MNQLVEASEADPDLGFMARLLALCSLPRTNPGQRYRYVRRNGPYTLVMSATGINKLPYGNLPRLLLAWVSTEAVRTQSRELVLGRSLSEFMRALGLEPVGGVRTRLRNQMRRLFSAHVSLVYEDKRGMVIAGSQVADRAELWWNERKPDEPSLWQSKIELGEKFFNEIISHPVPIDMNTLTALKRSPRWASIFTYGRGLPHLHASRAAAPLLAAPVPAVRSGPFQGRRSQRRAILPAQGSARVEEDQARLAGAELCDGTGRYDPVPFKASHPGASTTTATRGIALNGAFLAQGSPLTAPRVRGVTLYCLRAGESRAWGVLSDCCCEGYPQMAVIRGSFPVPKPTHILYQNPHIQAESLYQNLHIYKK